MKSSPVLPDCRNLRPGDIIGFSGYNPASYFINLVTYGIPGWSLSHVGIVAEYEGNLLIFESTDEALDPCAVQGYPIAGTQAQWPVPRIQSYKGRVWHYPLVKPLRSWERRHLTEFLLRSVGRPYDRTGAVRAGAKVWSAIQGLLHDESIAALFCSEWVAAAHRHIERFDTKHIGTWSPNALVREETRRGILDERVRLK